MNPYVHGHNIGSKIAVHKIGAKHALIMRINKKYLSWHKQNEAIRDITKDDIIRKTLLLNEYKTFVRSANKVGNKYIFSFQSKLEPTILEEFLYYLFKDLPDLKRLGFNLGPAKAYVDMGFSPNDLKSFANDVSLDITTKDQDFAISRPVFYIVSLKKDKKLKYNELSVPIVAIEVKTWLDKTMLVGSAGTAEKLKSANPNSLFLIVTETTGVGKEVTLNRTRIDEIFVIRKQRSQEKDLPDRLKPIDADVIWVLFLMVKNHLAKKWVLSSDDALDSGQLIQRN